MTHNFHIDRIQGIEILDSRGTPTVEAEVLLRGGHRGRAAVPSGASTGSREALELRDHVKDRYHGRGVLKAIGHINGEIQSVLQGKDARDHQALDKTLLDLDGSKSGTKERLGANAILAVSLATAHAAAAQEQLGLYRYIRKNLYDALSNNSDYVLPRPMMNFVNGGAHANNALDFQEFMLVPHGAETFEQAMEWASRIFQYSQKELRRSQKEQTTSQIWLNASSFGVGDEGGFSIQWKAAEDEGTPGEMIYSILSTLTRLVKGAGYTIGLEGNFAIAMDPAASEFFKGEQYILGGRRKGNAGEEHWSSEKLVDFYEALVRDFPIISIEDGMAEADEEGWKLLTTRLGDKCQLVGDDNFVTNPQIFTEGIRKGIGNAILVKVNQIGTLTEALDVVKIAKDHGYQTIVSHRSGETEDTTIADIAVAVNAGQIKTGCLSRADRVAKYNRLLHISRELGAFGTFEGHSRKVTSHS